MKTSISLNLIGGVVILLLPLFGCSQATFTPKEYVYVREGISDSLLSKETHTESDTFYVATKIDSITKDTIYISKFYPKNNYITLEGRRDTVRVRIEVPKEKLVEVTPFYVKIGMYIAGGLILILSVLLVIKSLKW